MDDSIVTLRNTPITLDSDVGRQFVVDCVRAGEGLITDRELAEKYELDPPACHHEGRGARACNSSRKRTARA